MPHRRKHTSKVNRRLRYHHRRLSLPPPPRPRHPLPCSCARDQYCRCSTRWPNNISISRKAIAYCFGSIVSKASYLLLV
jgi:hypothetical protein